MKNIFEQLKEEHDEVAALIEKLADTTDDDIDTRQQLFPELQLRLLAHAKAEEKEFYPRVRDLNESIESEIDDDLQEHHSMEETLERLAAMSYGDARWLEQLGELKDCVEHHVDDEENELFPQVEEFFTEEEAREIAELYVQEKQQQLESLASGDEDYAQMTKDELYELAKEREIEGRSQMTKDQLIDELRQH